ncbi:excalibur calcium-binding domain-containing protein [Phenylobacterium terrae]|uniref:Excalibur calcium-binding domain-containing protein n=1 Tax=Phenylobacterium terrae TaxID=2665495 RepID=A0ABW4N5U5_9CAUL
MKTQERVTLAVLLGGITALLIGAAPVDAHGGGSNAEGCHNNRKTGDYDCHRGAGAAPTARFTSQGGRGDRPIAALANCSAARAAGVAPVRRGQRGYGRHLDGTEMEWAASEAAP